MRYWLCSSLTSAHLYESELLSLYLGFVYVLTRLYYERSCRRARMPGGIHLRLLGRYEYVAMWPTSENSVKANFVEIVFHALRWISFRECGEAYYRVIEHVIL